MVFQGREVVLKIWSYIKLVLDSMKDYRLRNSKLAKLILEYSIVLSIFIIIFGLYVVFSSFDKTVSNTMIIDPALEDSPQILITVEYKEPFACGDVFKITGISVSGNESLDYNNILLDIYSPLYESFFPIFLDNDRKTKPGQTINLNNRLVNLLFTSNEYNGQLMEQRNDYVYYLYFKIGDIKNKTFAFGNINLKYPIICMDYVTQTNVSINKSLLKLTGILIILGSISFVISLRQLFNKK